MFVFALRSKRAKTRYIIFAELPSMKIKQILHVMLLKLSAFRSLRAKATLIVGAWLVSRLSHITAGGEVGVLLLALVLIEALITLLAVTILLEIAANRQFIFVVDMKKTTFVSFLACAL